MKAFRHAGIVVSDVEKALHFYGDLLGLKMQRDMVEEGPFVNGLLGLENAKVRTMKMSADDGVLLELLHYLSPEHVRKPEEKEMNAIGASHVAFTVEDMDSLYEILKKEGVRFNAPPAVSADGKAKVAYCYDPDGTPIELVQML